MKAIESYDGKVRLGTDGHLSDIDSIMGIIALGLCQGDTVTIEVEGEDELRMADELVKLFETHFDFPPR